jgi:hypothetical protein
MAGIISKKKRGMGGIKNKHLLKFRRCLVNPKEIYLDATLMLLLSVPYSLSCKLVSPSLIW